MIISPLTPCIIAAFVTGKISGAMTSNAFSYNHGYPFLLFQIATITTTSVLPNAKAVDSFLGLIL
jgi:hypothetical protein